MVIMVTVCTGATRIRSLAPIKTLPLWLICRLHNTRGGNTPVRHTAKDKIVNKVIRLRPSIQKTLP